jgi:hypothetical protein
MVINRMREFSAAQMLSLLGTLVLTPENTCFVAANTIDPTLCATSTKLNNNLESYDSILKCSLRVMPF